MSRETIEELIDRWMDDPAFRAAVRPALPADPVQRVAGAEAGERYRPADCDSRKRSESGRVPFWLPLSSALPKSAP